jgi:hypothetical protein
VVVEPRSAEFRTVPLDPEEYSAILIGASKDDPRDNTQQDLNELDSTPDMDAINARAGEIRSFFAGGGGIFVSSGGRFGHERGADFYRFLPVTTVGISVAAPFALTALGRHVGFTDASDGTADDINCCVTHMSFELPAPESPLKPAELDQRGKAVTLLADAARLSDLDEPPLNPETIFAPVPRGTRRGCRDSALLRISLRRPRGVRFQRVTVFVNGTRRRTVGARRLGAGRRTKPFTIRLRRGHTSRVRIVALTTTGKRAVLKRKYTVCR